MRFLTPYKTTERRPRWSVESNWGKHWSHAYSRWLPLAYVKAGWNVSLNRLCWRWPLLTTRLRWW